MQKLKKGKVKLTSLAAVALAMVMGTGLVAGTAFVSADDSASTTTSSLTKYYTDYNSIDHIEAKTGKRCDSLIMSIYSSIMIASMPVGQGITNALVGSGETGTVIAYIWIETVCYAVGAIVLVFYTVERYLEGDRKIILDRQKAQAEAAGVEWIPPEERLRREEEEADRLAEEARIAELKARCQKKGLNFEEEEAAYQAKLAAKKNKKK